MYVKHAPSTPNLFGFPQALFAVELAAFLALSMASIVQHHKSISACRMGEGIADTVDLRIAGVEYKDRQVCIGSSESNSEFKNLQMVDLSFAIVLA